MTSLLDHHLISERYFFPRAEAPAEPFWVDCADGTRLACAYHETDPAAPTVVHFHGNGEVVADYLDGFPGLIDRMGCNCFFAEFRGYGGSTGTSTVRQNARRRITDDQSSGMRRGKDHPVRTFRRLTLCDQGSGTFPEGRRDDPRECYCGPDRKTAAESRSRGNSEQPLPGL